ncbi:hypothetical protein [Poseidonocella sp. HB161398]|uniref:hypothetical protein n=1 Tax=Poseidonocella sp. HB161398 TaxID=2320855 RepID=UPI001109A5FB|nr:hypothetical protein [Poseidonocella sp. HB161398]
MLSGGIGVRLRLWRPVLGGLPNADFGKEALALDARSSRLPIALELTPGLALIGTGPLKLSAEAGARDVRS